MGMEIFPNLPNDIGRECLLRVPCTSLYKLAVVCKSWKNTVSSPLFYQDRKILGLCQDFIIIIEAPNAKARRTLIIYDPLHNSRQTLPSLPMEFQHYSYQSHCVSVHHKLIAMGFSNEGNGEDVMVFVYDFSLGKWKRGANLPEGLEFFCCSVDSAKGLIYIAGGGEEVHDAAVYNVEENSWALLPPMNCAVDECYSGFIHGKFLVLSESKSIVQIYDPDVRVWTTTQNLDIDTVDACVVVFGQLYYFEWGDVIEYNCLENQLSVAGIAPPNLRFRSATVWRDRIFVWGTTLKDSTVRTNIFYFFERSRTEDGQRVKAEKWTPINTDSHLSNWIYSIAALKILLIK